MDTKRRIAVVVGLILFTLFAFNITYTKAGGIWDALKNTYVDGKLETNSYAIETQGINIRGYAYDVKSMKSICWNVFTESTHVMECKTYKEMGLSSSPFVLN